MGVENRDRLVRYWLGSLPEQERLHLEQECRTNDELAESLKEAENDLLDSYVCGTLSQEQRLQFEQNYLDSPERHEQLEIARLLMDPAVRQKIATTAVPIRPERSSWWRSPVSWFYTENLAARLAAVAATTVLATLLILLVIQNHRLQTELGRLQVEQAKLQQQVAELQRSGGQTGDAPVVVSALLKPGLSREGGNAGGNAPLKIPPSASSVVLRLDLPSDRYPRYSVVVETVEGKNTQRAQGLSSKPFRDGRIIEVLLSPQALPRGDYIVTLSGAKPNNPSQVVDSYIFSVL